MEEKKENKKVITSDNIDKITDKIYLGDIDGANEINYLKQEGITHIISLVGETYSPEYEEGLFKRKIIDIDDCSTENIFQYFKKCIEFIEQSSKIFIHCMAGVSRSASIVIAYLLWKERKSYNETYFYVKNKRRYIGPNQGFVNQLKYFEQKLKENNYDLEKIDFQNFDFNELKIEN